MRVVNVFYHRTQGDPVKVGEVVFVGGIASFQYNATFLASGINLSPFKLSLTPELQEASPSPFYGLHGVFADSLPDGWGLLLMDRSLKQRGVDIARINPVDRLAFVGSRAMGALSYQPDEGEGYLTGVGGNLDINQLAEASIKLYTGEVDEVLNELVDSSISPGGARPKSLIALQGNQAISGAHKVPKGFEHWIVKFPPGRNPDNRAEGVIEFLYAQMANLAGIEFPETKLIQGKHPEDLYFMVKRFDRLKNGQRVHMHTLAGLVEANFRVSDCDYTTLLKVCYHLTRSQQAVTQMFKRMVFNVVVGNRDDHTKNFSFLMDSDGNWQNSPAYDVTYNRGMSGWHSMSIGTAGQFVELENLQEVASTFSITPNAVNIITEEVCEAMETWFKDALHYPLPKSMVTEVSKHIDLQRKRLLPASWKHRPRGQ